MGDRLVWAELPPRLVWLALRNLLGYQDVKMDDGSWTGWGSIVGFPVER